MNVNRAYEGGYLIHPSQIMPTGPFYDHTAHSSDNLPTHVVDALNLVQATGWRLNQPVYDVMRECWLSGAHVNGMPSPDDLPAPERVPEEVWEVLDKTQRAKLQLKQQEVRRANNLQRIHRENLLRLIAVCERHRDDPFWFAWYLDWRGRMYPYGQDLQPQADGLTRAMLRFDKGHRVGERGWFWLCVRAATMMGHDKLSFDDRYDVTYQNLRFIARVGNDPFDDTSWMEFDDPFGFIATAMEISEGMKLDNVFDHISHLPVSMDGSCNGLQLLSIATRDPVGALATNCTSNPERQDLYMEVAMEVDSLMANDLAEGHEAAQAWYGKITRSTVKRAVMTTPYGVTPRGIRTQLIEDGFAVGLGIPPATAAEYLKGKIVEALSHVIDRPKRAMEWFQECARIIADDNGTVEWVTPGGMTISQQYRARSIRHIRTLSGRYNVLYPIGGGVVDKKKMVQGVAPNVVHSWDAALAHEVVLAMNHKVGCQDFLMVHDSYGVHPHLVDDLHTVIRETAIELFSGDVLQEWHVYVSQKAGVVLPPPPERGDYDIMELTDATFFFS